MIRGVVQRLCTVALLLLLACGGGARGTKPEPGASGPGPADGGHGPVLEQEWSWPAPPPASAGMPAADRSGVALTSGHRRITLLDEHGATRWEAERVGLRDVAPTFTPEVVLAASDDGVVAYDQATGRRRWEAALGERANTPVVAGGRAVVTTWEGSLVGLDLADGKVAWRARLGGDALGPAVALPVPSPAGSTVVATFDTGRVAGAVAVDTATGRQRWAVPLPAGGVSAPAVATTGTVVVVAADLAAHGLAADDGAERWRRPVDGAGSPEVPPLALPDGTVLVAHRLGGMALVDGVDGKVHWRAAPHGAAVRGGPAGPGPNGWFALPLADGRLLLAGPDRPADVREPSGLVTGVAVGPGGLLLVATGQGPANGLVAEHGW